MRPERKTPIDAEIFRSTSVEPVGDLRFRNLLSETMWNTLPRDTRRRFSCRHAPESPIAYIGQVREIEMGVAGWIFAQIARLVGGPLPTSTACCGASVVTVTEDAATGGQVWTRVYARHGRFPQVIHSSKQFSGPTGLEEYVGRGVGMTLQVCVENGALQFRSANYFVRLWGRRFAIPRWCTPGALTVTHADAGSDSFVFTLDIVHPLFGRILRQSAIFREATS